MAELTLCSLKATTVILLLVLQIHQKFVISEDLSPVLMGGDNEVTPPESTSHPIPFNPDGKVFMHPDCPLFPGLLGHFSPKAASEIPVGSADPFEHLQCCMAVPEVPHIKCFAYMVPSSSSEKVLSSANPEVTSNETPSKNPEDLTEKLKNPEDESQKNNSEDERNPDKKILDLNEPRSWDCDCTNEGVLINSIPDIILSSRLNPSQRRYNTFKRALELMLKYNAKVLVETGTARYGNTLSCFNDGCSTMFFGHYALLTKSKLFSVDISQASCLESIKSTEQFIPYVEVVLSDSLKFLQEFNYGPVDFLYLDSFDWSEQDSEVSQRHHLEEIKRIYHKLHRRSIVLIDDCALPHGGKCGLVHNFLMEQGWTIIMKDYQHLYLYQK